MGFLKGFLLFILTTLIGIALLAGNFSLMLYLSTSNGDFQNSVVESISSAVQSQGNVEEQVQSVLPEMKTYCQTHAEISYNSSGLNVTIPCAAVNNGSQAVINAGISSIISQKSPDSKCDSSISCFLKYKGLLFSEQAKTYWRTILLLSVFISLILLAAMFFIVENKKDFPFTAGILVLFSSLPFLAIKFMIPYLENSILKPVAALLSGAFAVFITAFGIGIILIALGFALRFMGKNPEQKQRKK